MCLFGGTLMTNAKQANILSQEAATEFIPNNILIEIETEIIKQSGVYLALITLVQTL